MALTKSICIQWVYGLDCDVKNGSAQTRRLLHLAVAFCVGAHLLMTMAMAASPELHRYFHGDADGEDHECVVTHLNKGDLHDGAPTILVTVGLALPTNELGRVVAADSVWVAPLFLKNGVLEHAPPLVR
jgi:hypothetical protein